VENYRAAVDDGVFVEPGGQTAPLLEQVESAFDHVATPVINRIECGRTATTRGSPLAVPLLVGGFWDDRDDAASTQMRTDRA
jgi:hypothetical protein